MNNLLIKSKPIGDNRGASLQLQVGNDYSIYDLNHNDPISITVADEQKYCVGWRDIERSQDHPCEQNATVDSRYEECYHCRAKTGFNPAFYNTTEISAQQEELNRHPHYVYVAYFGDGIAKAGITHTRRGMERLYEQGALLYVIIEESPNATVARNLESRLVHGGLKESVLKRQKSNILTNAINLEKEISTFQDILAQNNHPDAKIISNLDHFFFDSYPQEPILILKEDQPVSGIIKGVVGRYLILDNNDRLCGVWLSDFFGKQININSEITPIEHEPVQVSLF